MTTSEKSSTPPNLSGTAPSLPSTAGLINLAEDRLGARMLYATDDFFAAKERLIQTADPVSKLGTYDDHGQWMDGWESRRRRGGGHDYCIVELAFPGYISLVDIDTTYFTGNHPPRASLDAISSNIGDIDPLAEDAPWKEILATAELGSSQPNPFAIDNPGPWKFIRLQIYPDGGVARLRVHGRIERDWEEIKANLEPGELLDLFAVENGGVPLLCNDQHYGTMYNLNRAGRGINMGDGWETRRRREPGNDWVIVKLGHPGVLKKVSVDTAHFKGNYPESVALEGIYIDPETSTDSDITPDLDWQPLMPKQLLSADAEHEFHSELADHKKITHVKINIFPDGGLSRVRLIGTLA